MYILAKYFQPSVIFECKAAAYPSGAHLKTSVQISDMSEINKHSSIFLKVNISLQPREK
jgi:hypothetical protein